MRNRPAQVALEINRSAVVTHTGKIAVFDHSRTEAQVYFRHVYLRIRTEQQAHERIHKAVYRIGVKADVHAYLVGHKVDVDVFEKRCHVDIYSVEYTARRRGVACGGIISQSRNRFSRAGGSIVSRGHEYALYKLRQRAHQVEIHRNVYVVCKVDGREVYAYQRSFYDRNAFI